MSIVEMRVPVIGESVTEVTLSQWLKGDGEYVNMDEPICEFESDKATLEFPAEAAGKLIYVAAEEDDLEIGALVAKIDTSAKGGGSADAPKASAKPAAETKEEAPAADPESEDSYAAGHPSPAAAKILKEAGIDAGAVKGSGKGGRITKADAEAAVANKGKAAPAKPAAKSAPASVAASAPSSFSRNTERKKMSRMRRTIASRLVTAKNQSAMLTTLQIDGDHVIFHDYADISFAISTETGLVVPPIKNCESLGYHEIEIKLKELAKKARDGKLTLAEMQGGTFSITNGGVFGSLLSTPILNRPQSAILGMHGIQQRPVAINGKVEIRPMMYLALSYDHQVIDGKSSVTFLVKVKQLLEDPVKLLFGL